jgi:hypothetical protein
LSPGGETYAVLDTNVLIPPRLSDILFDLALQKLYRPYWTSAIEAEFLRNWVKVVANTFGKQALVRTTAHHRLQCFRRATNGEYDVVGYNAFESAVPAKTDPKDRHVVAAGLALKHYAEANDRVFIVSSNVKHLAKRDTGLLGVTVATPGEFIDLLFGANPTATMRAMRAVVNDLSAPPYTKEQLVSTLREYKASTTATALAVLELKPAARMAKRSR